MRRSDDPSLFAWGQVHWGDDYWKVWELGDKFESIFAPSPSAFVAGHDITFADDDPAVSDVNRNNLGSKDSNVSMLCRNNHIICVRGSRTLDPFRNLVIPLRWALAYNDGMAGTCGGRRGLCRPPSAL